jgi:hypothetical protein
MFRRRHKGAIGEHPEVWGCAVRRSDLLPLRLIAFFVITPRDRLDAIGSAS